MKSRHVTKGIALNGGDLGSYFASFACRICHKREDISCKNIVTDIRIPKILKGPAVELGRENESKAKVLLQEVLKDKIINSGLIIYPNIIGIAASPDGTLEKSGDIVEIKCPFSAATYKRIEDTYYFIHE